MKKIMAIMLSFIMLLTLTVPALAAEKVSDRVYYFYNGWSDKEWIEVDGSYYVLAKAVDNFDLALPSKIGTAILNNKLYYKANEITNASVSLLPGPQFSVLVLSIKVKTSATANPVKQADSSSTIPTTKSGWEKQNSLYKVVDSTTYDTVKVDEIYANKLFGSGAGNHYTTGDFLVTKTAWTTVDKNASVPIPEYCVLLIYDSTSNSGSITLSHYNRDKNNNSVDLNATVLKGQSYAVMKVSNLDSRDLGYCAAAFEESMWYMTRKANKAVKAAGLWLYGNGHLLHSQKIEAR